MATKITKIVTEETPGIERDEDQWTLFLTRLAEMRECNIEVDTAGALTLRFMEFEASVASQKRQAKLR